MTIQEISKVAAYPKDLTYAQREAKSPHLNKPVRVGAICTTPGHTCACSCLHTNTHTSYTMTCPSNNLLYCNSDYICTFTTVQIYIYLLYISLNKKILTFQYVKSLHAIVRPCISPSSSLNRCSLTKITFTCPDVVTIETVVCSSTFH